MWLEEPVSETITETPRDVQELAVRFRARRKRDGT